MAVGNPYGKGGYGSGPYARYGTSRPYGVGPYGTGPYSTWGGNTFDVAGITAISFAASADPHVTYQPYAVTSIVWNVVAYDPNIEMHPWAISEIVFSVQGELTFTWPVPQPCEGGVWTPAAPCEGGSWTATVPCTQGSWNGAA